MSLLSLGISHKNAPVELRERIAFTQEMLPRALAECRDDIGLDGIVILSTCNRTELYCGIDADRIPALTEWLAKYHDLSLPELEHHLYHHLDFGAIRHLFRVAAGLDSMVLGEPQILGQLKQSYQISQHENTLAPELDRMFQSAFSVAKTIRSDTELGKNPVSVAYAAATLAKQIFGELFNKQVLLIGAGETIELAARHLYHNGVGGITIANRSLENAEKMAAAFQASVSRLEDIGEHLVEADIVISATASSQHIITKDIMQYAYNQRQHRMLFMVDLAVPRDIAPEIETLEEVYLYTVDDLQDVISENLKARQQAAKQAEEIIDYRTEQFIGWQRQQGVTRLIREYREYSESLRDDVLAKTEAMIRAGRPHEEALRFLANTLSNKLCHLPSTALREAGRTGNQSLVHAFADAMKEIEVEKNTREPDDQS